MPQLRSDPTANSYAKSENFPAEMMAERQARLNGEPVLPVDEQARETRRAQLASIGSLLARKRDEWVLARQAAGVDRRWRDDQDQYNAIDSATRAAASLMETVENGGVNPVQAQASVAHRSTVFIGLTRQKSNSAEARLSDIVLPTDEKNYGVGPTPNPQLARALTDETPLADELGQPRMTTLKDPTTGLDAVDADGAPIQQPLRVKDQAAKEDQAAREAAAAMEQEIDDQLVECDYAGEVRKMLHDAAVYGAGVLKGPIVTNRVRKAWIKHQDAEGAVVHMLKIVKETRPASRWVPVWNFFPDPACGDDVQNGEGVFERELLPRRAVQELAQQPGYDLDALRDVLRSGPQQAKVFTNFTDPRVRNLAQNTLFEVWHYVGELAVEDMVAFGAMQVDGDIDPLERVSACAVMINDVVVKMYPNPDEAGELPYDVYPWEKVSDSLWGYGVPYLMRSQQRVLNAAWRQMMDNAGITSGPQIVLKRSVIQPADSNWNLYSRKLWYADADVEDVEKAFMVFNIDSHQSELANIIKLAEDLADKETGQPLITQGEQGSAPETVGGMQMLMNSANVVLRRLVKQYDDYVTKRHIRRYYNYNMAYSENDAIKGDFEVHAKGSSALLVRDIQNQAYLQLLQLAAPGTPWSFLFESRDLMAKALSAQHIPADDVLKSKEKLRQEAEIAAKNPPQNPDMMVAEARVAEAKARADGYTSEIALRKEIGAQNFAAQLEKLRTEKEIEMLKHANATKQTLEKVRADLTKAVINDQTKKQLQATEIALKQSPANPTNEGI